MDEIDQLSSSKSDRLVYRAFEWPKYSKGKVITIGIFLLISIHNFYHSIIIKVSQLI